MREATLEPQYTTGEELANSIIHGIGILLSVAGLVLLTVFAYRLGTVWHIVSCGIYGVSMVLLYTASTLYHSVSSPRAKAALQVFDHCAIFLLIAGTYTPLTLVNLRGPWGWSLFGVVWGLAVAGIALQPILLSQKKWVTALPYIVMGWVALAGIKPLIETVAPGGLFLLFCGGVFYTAGSLFYVWRSLPYHHAIWHGFVLAGSICHFFCIFFFVIPIGQRPEAA